MYRDSGVVMRMCGGRLASFCRSEAGVSPVRTAVVICGMGVPVSSASAAISSSGVARFFWISLDSAFSGETYTTCVVSGRSASIPCRTSWSMQVRKAVSVLPDPVGAAISVCRPSAMAGQPAAWASVGASNRLPNHLWITG